MYLYIFSRTNIAVSITIPFFDRCENNCFCRHIKTHGKLRHKGEQNKTVIDQMVLLNVKDALFTWSGNQYFFYFTLFENHPFEKWNSRLYYMWKDKNTYKIKWNNQDRAHTVSVAKRAFTRPSWKSSSTSSLIIGSSPEWCTAMPRLRSGNINSIAGKLLSSSTKQLIALRKTCSMHSFSSSVLKSSFDIDMAWCSHSLLLKLKIMTGWNLRSIIIWKLT